MPDAVRHRSRHTVHAVGKPAVVVIGVPEIGDCENDQKSDKHSHLISPSPSARALRICARRRRANLCQINVDQSDGRHSLVFFWIESVPIKFAACGALDLRSEPIEIL
jgi:hypothetical protein